MCGFCNVWVCVCMALVMCGCFDNCVGVLVITRGSAAARFLGLSVRIPPGSWMPVCCECRGLYVGLITRPECDHESSIMRRPLLTGVVAPW